MLYDTSKNNREKWIQEIQKYTCDKNIENTIQYCLSYTLQALRKGDENQYKWRKGDCE